ncbi:MAG: Doc protein [candidate division TM6 bacterium GW2011_GWF2_28_16]|nr:MAG: Doc protein [candidate division TM6 bacterium GW2011_GWF2_28_16]
MTAIIFLELNGYIVNFTNEELVNLGLDIACSKLDKNKIAKIFKNKIVN